MWTVVLHCRKGFLETEIVSFSEILLKDLNMWTVVLYCPGGTQDSVQTEQTSDCRTPKGNLTVA